MNQRQNLEQFCTARGLVVDEWLEEIGGGLNLEPQEVSCIVDSIIAGDVGMLVIAHKDRLARFGFSLIGHLCEVYHCELIVMNNQSLSPEQELTQDLLSILHSFSRRLYGLRNYQKTLKEALAHGSDNDQSPQDTLEPNA